MDRTIRGLIKNIKNNWKKIRDVKRKYNRKEKNIENNSEGRRTRIENKGTKNKRIE